MLHHGSYGDFGEGVSFDKFISKYHRDAPKYTSIQKKTTVVILINKRFILVLFLISER